MAASVAARLRDLILDGKLPGGTPLALGPLATSLNVSVMPVREALGLLEAEGLVVKRPRRGALVSEPSIEEAEEIYAIRIALESLCARHAAERLSAQDVADLREAYALMAAAAQSNDVRSFLNSDHEFHLRLYRLSGRDRLVKSIEELTGRSLRYIPYLHRSHEAQLESHGPLLSAIELRDVQLIETLTRTHMERSWADVQAAIRQSTEEHAGRGPRLQHGGAEAGSPRHPEKAGAPEAGPE